MALPALAIAGIAAAGASLVGSGLSAASNKNANETNFRIAQMNNEFNERMMDKSMQYQTDMWNKANEYNTPANQRKRLEEAGLNPYLMMNGGSAGIAQNVGGVNPAQAQGVTMQPNKYDFSGIGNAALAYAQLNQQQASVDAQNRLTNMQADWYGAKALADIENIKSQTDSHTAKTYWQKVQNHYAQGLASSAYQNQMLKNQEIGENIKNIQLQNNMIQKELSIFDDRTRLEIAGKAADVQLRLAQGKLTKQQAAHEIYKQMETTCKVRGLKINNSVLRRTADSLVEKARYDAYYKAGGPFDFINRIGQRIDNYMK